MVKLNGNSIMLTRGDTLRANQVVTLGEKAIEGTLIAEGSGYIYVPQSLVSAYQADSAWNTYSSQIRAIE